MNISRREQLPDRVEMLESEMRAFRVHSESKELSLGISEASFVRAQGDVIFQTHLKKHFEIFAELVE